MIKVISKCSECVKVRVCKHVFDYEHDCSHLPNQIINETTELKISCTEFFPVAPTVREAAR